MPVDYYSDWSRHGWLRGKGTMVGVRKNRRDTGDSDSINARDEVEGDSDCRPQGKWPGMSEAGTTAGVSL